MRSDSALPLAVFLLALPLAGGAQQSVDLPRGTEIPLTLLHHLNSKHTSAGDTVYLSVSRDVVLDGTVAVSRGQVVEGFVVDKDNRRYLGKGGLLEIGVRIVVATDGQDVPVRMEHVAEGSGSRRHYGFPGDLLSKGRAAYVRKGTQLIAETLADRRIAPSPLATEGESAAVSSMPAEIKAIDTERIVDLDRGWPIEPVDVWVEMPAGTALSSTELGLLSVIRIDDVTLPVPLPPLGIKAKEYDRDRDGLSERRVTYDGWKVLRFCDDGPCRITLRIELDGGSVVEGSTEVNVQLKARES